MQRIMHIMIVCTAAVVILSGQSVNVTVSNPSPHPRNNETITVSLAGLSQSFPEFSGKDLAVYEGSKQIVHQLADENGDGANDIVIFQSSFKPKEQKKFTIKNSAGKDPAVTVVDGRFILPRQDFAWENDRIAFRVYGSALAGDVRNGIDIWTKRVRYPIVEKWYAGEEQVPKRSYHEDHGEGADYFSVGKSLGCGGSALMVNGKMIQPGIFSNYRIITNGPIRVSFELFYSDIRVDTVSIIGVKRITLDAGSNLNKIEDRFISKFPAGGLQVVSGLVKRKNTKISQHPEKGYMTLWGLTTADSAVGYLGTAVIMNSQQPCSAMEDTLQWMICSSVGKEVSLTYYAGAGWTRSGDFLSESDWTSYVEKYSENVKQPLTVQISKSK